MKAMAWFVENICKTPKAFNHVFDRNQEKKPCKYIPPPEGGEGRSNISVMRSGPKGIFPGGKTINLTPPKKWWISPFSFGQKPQVKKYVNSQNWGENFQRAFSANFFPKGGPKFSRRTNPWLQRGLLKIGESRPKSKLLKDWIGWPTSQKREGLSFRYPSPSCRQKGAWSHRMAGPYATYDWEWRWPNINVCTSKAAQRGPPHTSGQLPGPGWTPAGSSAGGRWTGPCLKLDRH